MRRFLLTSFLLSGLALAVNAQTVTINPAPLSTTQLNGLGSSNYHVSEYIYTDAELGAGNFTSAATAINQINLNLTALGGAGALTFSNVKIYLQNVPSTTTALTAGTYSTAGYTEVYNGTFPATAIGWNGVTLTTPFVRTAGSNLLMMIERTDNVVPTAPPPTWQSTIGNTGGSRRYNGSAALSGTTALSVSAHRVVVQFRHAVANDAGVVSFTSIGKLPIGYGSPSTVTAIVTNTGTTALTNLPVTLNVTGANTYTETKTVASLASGASTIVVFTGYAPTVVGTNSLSVSVPADGDNTNNTVASQNQVTTASTYALSNDDAFTANGSIGFNTGSGNLLVQMPVYKNNTLTGIRVSISSTASTAGNTVYGVLLSSTGTIIAQTPNYVIQPTDLGQFVTFNFTSPQAVTAGTTYYIGLGQTANATTGYFPVNTQATKPNLSHSTVLAGGAVTNYATFGSLMIEGQFAVPFPVELISFTGARNGRINKLSWETATEINNAGFEMQRSANGIEFSSIGSIASKAERGNSGVALSYNFDDVRPLSGVNYYRLKQMDLDGRISYSSIVVIKAEETTTISISAVYPNPAQDEVKINLTSPSVEGITLSVVDLSGKLIRQSNMNLVKGDNIVKIDVSQLNAGNYYIRMVTSTGEILTSKFIKN